MRESKGKYRENVLRKWREIVYREGEQAESETVKRETKWEREKKIEKVNEKRKRNALGEQL